MTPYKISTRLGYPLQKRHYLPLLKEALATPLKMSTTYPVLILCGFTSAKESLIRSQSKELPCKEFPFFLRDRDYTSFRLYLLKRKKGAFRRSRTRLLTRPQGDAGSLREKKNLRMSVGNRFNLSASRCRQQVQSLAQSPWSVVGVVMLSSEHRANRTRLRVTRARLNRV
jgi:hypothetical protein